MTHLEMLLDAMQREHALLLAKAEGIELAMKATREQITLATRVEHARD